MVSTNYEITFLAVVLACTPAMVVATVFMTHFYKTNKMDSFYIVYRLIYGKQCTGMKERETLHRRYVERVIIPCSGGHCRCSEWVMFAL